MRVLLVLVLLSCAAPAAAQSFDVTEQEIVVDVTDELRVTIDATVRATAASDVLFLPAFLSEVVELTVGGAPVSFAPHPSYPEQVLVVTLAEPVAAETELGLRVVTAGAPGCRRGAPLGYTWCWHGPEETILPGGAPGRAWFLFDLFTEDTFVGSVDVRAPRGFVARAGQGEPIATVDESDATVWRFGIERPTSMVGLYAGVADVATGEGFPFEVLHHADRDDADKVARLAQLGAELYPLYGELFGVLPTESARIVLVPRDFGAGGMGLMGSPFIAEYAVGELDYLLEQGAAHELAHSWWPGIASASDPTEAAFLSEAFAEYSAWRALGERSGADVRVSGTRMNATFYMYRRPGDDDVRILDPDAYAHPAFVHATYHKGSLVVRMLETRVGQEAFTRALRALLARGPGGLSVAALAEEIESASGEDVRSVLDEWLRAPGYPRLVAASDRIEVLGAYHLRVPVRQTFGDGRQEEERLDVETGATVLERSKDAVLVEIDPAWSFVREVQPAVEGDVTLDGLVDAADLIAIALRSGTVLPEERRRDGGYDPLFDLDGSRAVDAADVERALALAR